MPEPFPLKDELETPAHVLALFDEDINSGKAAIHPWQIEFTSKFAEPRPNDNPIRTALIAANGSGKSQFILAPSILWVNLVFEQSLCVLTTASGEQLETQSFRYTRRLCDAINNIFMKDFGMQVFDINRRHITNLINGSIIDAFATDEPGKAEGRHPIGIGNEFAIFVDEAKTVADGIFQALERCTGFTRRLDISSPGDTSGYFYEVCTHPETPYYVRKVNAFECPHLNKQEIEWKIKKYGLHDPLIRSSIFAEFTSTNDSVVITREMLVNSQKYFEKEVLFGEPRAGLDLSAGGDETAMAVFHGNVMKAMETCRSVDTSKTVRDVIDWIKKHNLKPENINADDGGVGRGILDNLREKGYPLNRILNQRKANDSIRYANRGTELWFNFKLFVENYQVKLLPDSMLQAQLCNRYFKVQQLTNKLLLESKQESRKKGHPSPDRADAVVLAWANIFFPYDEISHADAPKTDSNRLTPDELARVMLEEQHQHLRAIAQRVEPSNRLVNVNDKGQIVKKQFAGFKQDRIFRPERKHKVWMA